jgi:hypothetical protein
MWGMRRSRATDVSLGLIILLINIGLVVLVVSFVGGESEPPPETSTKQTQTGTPAPTPSGTTRPGPAPSDVSTLVSRDADLTLAVLGDGTGDEEGEWVTVLGELLGEDREVKVNNLDPSDPTRYARALKYGSGEHSATIWNGSRRGASADYAADRLSFLVPDKPDAVLLSYGRDDKANRIGSALDKTFKTVRAKYPSVPVVVVLQAQNADDTIAPVREAAAEWAATKKLPTIDVAAAFRAAGDPNSFVSIVDPPSVNARGGELWGQTVFRALGGQLPDEEPTSQPVVTTQAAFPGAGPLPQANPWPATTPEVSPTPVTTEPVVDPTPADTPTVAEPTSSATYTRSRPTQTSEPTPTETTPLPDPIGEDPVG